ncbi:hypothetical protein [Arsukibacterium sp.]|uniref:hypothetical protein n=1 Tax=Arsukibacterium sp. TaxID=1977258 RepID=UPI001BD5BB02|nr:hypothetical protein [Arsukibacterium sp.]
MNTGLKLVFCLLVTGLLAPAALAHKFSTAYMDVTEQAGQPVLLWKVALHDLAQAKLLVADNSHQVSWQQVMDSATTLNTYLISHIGFSSAGQPCQLKAVVASDWQLQRLQRDLYLLLPIAVDCANSDSWQLTYQALFTSEPSHKLLLSWQVPGAEANAVLAADSMKFPNN